MYKLNGLDSTINVYKTLKLIRQQMKIKLCCLCVLMFSAAVFADPSQIPLSLTTAGKPNVLVILDNSNSMDEDPDGVAVGSNCKISKSEIARYVIKGITNKPSYIGNINMGLMTYQLSATVDRFIYDSQYDVSYNPANYTPSVINLRASQNKSYSLPNPMSANDFIYYNYRSPFYLSSNTGNTFCYSTTANAAASLAYPDGFNNGEIPGAGPWDRYRCFNNKAGKSDTLPLWGGLLSSATNSELSQGYQVLSKIYDFSPSDSDIAAGILDFGNQLSLRFIGSAYRTSTTPGAGYLQTPIAELNTAQSTAMGSLLACNVPTTTPAACAQYSACSSAGIKNAGNTPTQGTLQTASQYFSGTLNAGNAFPGYTASSYSLPESCGKNYVILVTDGMPDIDTSGHIVVDPVGVAPGTTAINAAATAAANLLASSSKVKTYVVGFGKEAQKGPLDLIATAGGTGVSYSAQNINELDSVINSILHDILSISNSASSVAANSTQLNTGTLLYQAKYNATDWSGQLLAYSVDTSTGALITPALWEASALLSGYNRHIYSYNPSSGGIPFLWANLSTTQQTYLGSYDELAWLSGDQSKEQVKAKGSGFRKRTNLLGDIVNSDPVYVGSKDYGYAILPGAEGSSYHAFLNSSAYINRTAMLYVGANDGMLHGFNASSTAGQEVFAYIPNALYPNLSELTTPNYVHQFYVDGISGVGDFYDGSTWHTLLAGATGAGGKALFALDVTNPNNFSASNVLWEFTNITPPVVSDCSAWGPTSTNYDVNDLGYTLGQPSVVRLQDGHWVVLAANGYNSVNGYAVLFILDANSGCVIQKIDTSSADTSGLTTVNGLSSPVAVDTNYDRSADTIYAGDLHGNLWKFDVSGIAGSYPTPTAPFFVACTSSGSCPAANRQAITAKPAVGSAGGVGADQNGVGWMVYFGTGQYFSPGDNLVGTNPQVQSFYGLWDQGTSITDRGLLQAQTMTSQGVLTLACTANNSCQKVGSSITPTTTTPNSVTVVSKNPVCYAASSMGCTANSSFKSGWVFDLNYPIVQGERVVSAPILTRGFLVFATLIPSADQCTAGGTSNLFELGALNGGQSGMAAFDINADGVVNSQDQVLVNGAAQFVSGINLNIGIINTPTIITSTTVDYKYVSGSTGAMAYVPEVGGSGGGTTSNGVNTAGQSWRQLK